MDCQYGMVFNQQTNQCEAPPGVTYDVLQPMPQNGTPPLTSGVDQMTPEQQAQDQLFHAQNMVEAFWEMALRPALLGGVAGAIISPSDERKSGAMWGALLGAAAQFIVAGSIGISPTRVIVVPLAAGAAAGVAKRAG